MGGRVIQVKEGEPIPKIVTCLTDEDFKKGMEEMFADFYYDHPDRLKVDEQREKVISFIGKTKKYMKLNENKKYDFSTEYWKKVRPILMRILGYS